jgi:diguanylate cyclase (GGDEF)-like protein
MKLKIHKIFEVLEYGGLVFWMPAGIVLIGLLGAVDSLTGNEITFSFFYLAPLVLVTWSVDQRAGLLMSALSALTMLGAEIAAGEKYSWPGIYVLNTLIRAGFFMVVTYLVAALRKSQREERLAARTDFVTGAFNARYFAELLQREIDRIRRYPHPITVVFIDIDNFKLVNDLFGHQIGDEVLRCIASELKSQLRRTDIIARVGGDEFVMVLPATHPSEAQVVVSKTHAHLQEQMRQRNLPVTFSMGAVTCVAPPHSAEHVINMADELMYEVKKVTKNDTRFITWAGGNGQS